MRRTARRLAVLGGQALHGDLAGALSAVARWTWGDTSSIGFERDLRVRRGRPTAGHRLEVVHLDNRLANKLFRSEGLSGTDWTLLARRRCMWEEGLGGAMVAVNPAGDPVFLEWWIPPDESAHVERYFGALFPPMQQGRFLVEGSWVPPPHRGRGIMSEAMCLFGEVAHRERPENTRAVAFVDERNLPAIKSHQRAGSVPTAIRRESWRAGVLKTEFIPLPPGKPQPASAEARSAT